LFSRPGYKKRIPGQGMPVMTNPDKYGDLIIEFDVEYPHGLNSDQKLYIREALINNKKQHQQQNQNRKKNTTYAD
jgi:DnaJ-class molecular chaperone